MACEVIWGGLKHGYDPARCASAFLRECGATFSYNRLSMSGETLRIAEP